MLNEYGGWDNLKEGAPKPLLPEPVTASQIIAMRAEIERLQGALVRYGDRARMSNAPPGLQQTIDRAFAEAGKEKGDG